MKFYFHPQAELELSDTADYYDHYEWGLGLDFAEEVYSTIGRIIEYPTSSSEISQNTRRCLINRFPYGIIYQEKEQAIWIIAIANLHRKPGYWKKRI